MKNACQLVTSVSIIGSSQPMVFAFLSHGTDWVENLENSVGKRRKSREIPAISQVGCDANILSTRS
jgi:hypothetical protein